MQIKALGHLFMQINAFTKYDFDLMAAFIRYSWTVLFLDVPVAIHVVKS